MTDTAEYVTEPARVAEQNDAFRRHVCLGSPYPPETGALAGRLVCTAAVSARGLLFVNTCQRVIGFFTDFSADNDPDGFHDFGAIRIADVNVWWKIDMYDDAEMQFGSEAPDDPARTYRVLTILLPSDW